MNLNEYLDNRRKICKEERQPRIHCPQCLLSIKTCYCSEIRRFDPKIKFVILIHPLEVSRKIATGRMAHLILENSSLIKGHDYSQNEIISELISDLQNNCFVLFPGEKSLNLSKLSISDKRENFASNKNLVVFVIDGTWSTAKQTMQLSKNINLLPRICLSPSCPSTFRVRKQPSLHCLSTIEAIYETIQLLAEITNFDLHLNEHNNLLHVFNYMVLQQLSFNNKDKNDSK